MGNESNIMTCRKRVTKDPQILGDMVNWNNSLDSAFIL